MSSSFSNFESENNSNRGAETLEASNVTAVSTFVVDSERAASLSNSTDEEIFNMAVSMINSGMSLDTFTPFFKKHMTSLMKGDFGYLVTKMMTMKIQNKTTEYEELFHHENPKPDSQKEVEKQTILDDLILYLHQFYDNRAADESLLDHNFESNTNYILKRISYQLVLNQLLSSLDTRKIGCAELKSSVSREQYVIFVSDVCNKIRRFHGIDTNNTDGDNHSSLFRQTADTLHELTSKLIPENTSSFRTVVLRKIIDEHTPQNLSHYIQSYLHRHRPDRTESEDDDDEDDEQEVEDEVEEQIDDVSHGKRFFTSPSDDVHSSDITTTAAARGNYEDFRGAPFDEDFGSNGQMNQLPELPASPSPSGTRTPRDLNPYLTRSKKRCKWSEEETDALVTGISEYWKSPTLWADILNDPALSQILVNRSNVNLKDKFISLRNKGVYDFSGYSMCLNTRPSPKKQRVFV